MNDGIGAEFIEKTKFQYLKTTGRHKGETPPTLQASWDWEGETVDLPAPLSLDAHLKKLVDGRLSVREYGEPPLSRDELSYLLWCTQGVKEVIGNQVTMRTVPSAGARHALETFVLANRVEGLAPGLYRFRAIGHTLREVEKGGEVAANVAEACLGQSFVATAAATLIWVCIADRMTWRYAERGYRYLLLDAGHVCQNLYLAAESIGCGACAIGAFDDDALNAILRLDGEREFVIYLGAVGRKKNG